MLTRCPLVRTVAMLFCLQTAVSLLRMQPAWALEEIVVSYAGPTVTFLPAEVARQRGFLREQNLDIKLLLTRSEVDRAALQKPMTRQEGRPPHFPFSSS